MMQFDKEEGRNVGKTMVTHEAEVLRAIRSMQDVILWKMRAIGDATFDGGIQHRRCRGRGQKKIHRRYR